MTRFDAQLEATSKVKYFRVQNGMPVASEVSEVVFNGKEYADAVKGVIISNFSHLYLRHLEGVAFAAEILLDKVVEEYNADQRT